MPRIPKRVYTVFGAAVVLAIYAGVVYSVLHQPPEIHRTSDGACVWISDGHTCDDPPSTYGTTWVAPEWTPPPR